MTTAQLIVTSGGAVLVAFIVWFFWMRTTEGVRAAVSSDGYQEATVLVKGGYTPDTIRVARGAPVRLTFQREETAACSEQVVLDGFGRHAQLPQGQPVAVEFVPTEAGRFPFGCAMGMLKGTVVVE